MTSLASQPIAVPADWEGKQVTLVFTGVEQAGPSFEGRVFLNNAGAGAQTAREPASGYAGAFHVYGYGTPAPPAVAAAQAARRAGVPPVAPIEKRVDADAEALRAALAGSDQLTVTVVAVPADPGGPVPDRPFADVQLVLGRV